MTEWVERSDATHIPAFNPDETHRIFARPGCDVRATSADLGWRSLFVTLQHEPVTNAAYGGAPHHLLVMQLSGPVELTCGMGGSPITKTVIPGICTYIPSGEGFGIRFSNSLESAHLYLRSELVERALAERSAARSEQLHLDPFFGATEPLLEQLVRGCVAALQRAGSSGTLYVDCLAWAIAAHLVEMRASAAGHMSADLARGLSERQLRRVEDYIEAHLERDIGVDDLAEAAGLSPVYFARQFKTRTGTAPYRYLLVARIARAKRMLLADELPICEIALACGFCHQEHLTRAFKANVGLSPAAFRRARGRH